jgi:heat shock protein HspQ
MQHAKFSPGQIIHHRKFDYRGVIFDIDAVFNGTDEWYESVATSRPPKDEPWYHILVDNSQQTTYVAEQNLEATESILPVQHPLINRYFKNYADGRYFQKHANN